MTIRKELESAVAGFAKLNNLKVAWEGIPFDTTKVTEFLRVYFLTKAISNPTIDFVSKRTRGFMQIDVCVKDGNGSKRVEELAEEVAALYKPFDKEAFETVSIESYPQIGRAMIDANFRIVPVSIEYRQEL